MGFSRDQARFAITKGRDAQARVEWLLQHMHQVPAALGEGDTRGEDFVSGARRLLAERAPLETPIWFYHELKGNDTESIIARRVAEGERIEGSRCNYGKLMERILYFRDEAASLASLFLPTAESMLEGLQKKTSSNTGDIRLAVLGDASGFMEVICTYILAPPNIYTDTSPHIISLIRIRTQTT